MAKLIREHQLAANEITEKQLADLLRQLLGSGDIIRHVRQDGAQAIVYLPYAEVERLRGMYNELIMAVAQKFDGETRHETALRYIREREASQVQAGSAQGGSAC